MAIRVGCLGNCFFLALLWIWAEPANLTDAFTDARIQAQKLFGKAALTTYQGMAGALETWTPMFMPLLQKRLHELMRQILFCSFTASCYGSSPS
jgi:hypothetical protein